ncbi:myosin-binding protein 7-like [Rutidosis leptorrhynchoides]|uniref:myosin-binding protein 7-like n=1 Tax=Rutidosis leptorrhynchoides TaxID=125765 RepID=UPI003A99FE46
MIMESDCVNKECECGCSCCDNRACTQKWIRSVKRKLDELDEERHKLMIPGLLLPEVARVEIKNECGALREMVTNQQQTIRDLSDELEKEQNAASSAANEAMSMILRLQREKAEIEMEARQFKRFSEQKIYHDQHEIVALEELLYKREQTIQSLTCEVQAYKYRMMSYGLTESEAEGEKGVITRTNSTIANSENQFGEFDYIPYDYPPLKCNSNEQQQQQQQIYPESDNETIDIDKYTFTETPCSLKDIEQRINELEKSPRNQPVYDKVIVGHSPRKQKPTSRYSLDSTTSSFFGTIREDENTCFKKVDNASEYGSEMSDRIYTVDSIHYGAPYGNEPKVNVNTFDNEVMSTTKDSMGQNESQDPEVMKLYARLHALEADRESMRQAIINMRTDKAQLVLLKEIAQNLCKEMGTTNRMPVKKQSVLESFCQTIASFILWRRKASQTKYMFGRDANNAGLLMVLDKGSYMGHWRCVSRTRI